jgi:DHA2 family multidrug resistance protein
VEAAANTIHVDRNGVPLKPLSGLALVGVAVGAALTTFIVVLDLTICNVSIPSIAAGLGASPREGTWVITSYAVAEAIMVLMSGWLASRFGIARVLVVSLLWFGAASVLCGMAQNMDTLVLFRLLQGIGGGPLVPLSQTALLNNFPREKAPYAMAIWTAMGVLGPISGPIIGGYICDNYHWSWIFLINVPFIFVGALVLWRILGHRDPPPEFRPIDFIGMILMAISVAAMQLMLDRGHELDWFHSPLILSFLIVSLLGFVSLVMWELTDDHPFIDLGLFRHASFTVAMLVLCLWFGAFFGSIIISPLWLQTNMGYTATWAGLSSAPTGITMILMAPAVAYLTNRTDPRYLVTAGFLIAAATFLWRSHFNSDVTIHYVLISQIGLGLGLSGIFAPSLSIAFDSLTPQEMAGGNSLVAFIRTAAVAVSTSAFVTFWQDASVVNRAGMVDRIVGATSVDQITQTGLPPDKALHALDAMVQGQSVMLATNQSYLIFSVLAVGASFLIWLAPRIQRQARRPK